MWHVPVRSSLQCKRQTRTLPQSQSTAHRLSARIGHTENRLLVLHLQEGWTALLIAADKEVLPAVSLLLSAGANVNVQNQACLSTSRLHLRPLHSINHAWDALHHE